MSGSSARLSAATNRAGLRHPVEQCNDTLGPVTLNDAAAGPLPSEPAERRREPLGGEPEHHQVHAPIAPGLQAGDEHQADIPPPEADGECGGGGIARVANDLLQNRQLVGLQLRRG
jgi:hypothetical protein